MRKRQGIVSDGDDKGERLEAFDEGSASQSAVCKRGRIVQVQIKPRQWLKKSGKHDMCWCLKWSKKKEANCEHCKQHPRISKLESSVKDDPAESEECLFWSKKIRQECSLEKAENKRWFIRYIFSSIVEVCFLSRTRHSQPYVTGCRSGLRRIRKDKNVYGRSPCLGQTSWDKLIFAVYVICGWWCN